ncbi:hypothetical protein BKA82DRAFT_4018076 [Pisolithus tinctorius]|nr:hypothetical protein BKA82DRAFT_4018076 [Pisolithus tinctorius]
MAPERTTGRGPQTARIARIKFSPYPKPDIGEALELRFARKSLRGGAGVIHPNDARDGKFLFRNGIKDLPDVAIKEAVLMKHAGRETRRYRALSSAWELREAEHYSNFMKYIYQADRKKYGEYLGDGQGDVDLDHAAEIDDAENFLAFGREAYNEDIMTFQTTNTQLDQLEEEVQCRVHDSSSEFDGSSDCDASDRYAESGVNDSKDGLMGPFFRDEGYLEVTGQGEGSRDGLDTSHHVPSELDTRTNCYNVSTINTTYHPPSTTIYHPPSANVYHPPSNHPRDRPTGGGEVARGEELDCIHIVPDRERPVSKLHPADQARPLTRPPTRRLPCSHTPTLVPIDLQPTATMHIPDYVVKRFKDEAKKELRRYFMMERPIRTTADSKYIKDLAIRLAEAYSGPQAKNMKTFRDKARHTLHKVTSTFKTVARLTLKDSYNLRVPIDVPHTTWIAETWRTSVEPLLVGWDLSTKKSGQTVSGFFNCCAVSTIIHEAIFSPCRKLSSVIPPDTENLDRLIAFTVTIIRWGLTNLVRGREAEFEADTYEPHYNNALRRIQVLRSEDLLLH